MSPKPWYADKARELLKARQQGMKPKGRVVVSLVGGDFSDVAGITLHARPDMPADRLDWRMLAGLEVWLWAGPGAALDWVLTTASRIAQAQPKTLLLRFEQGDAIHDIEVGEGFYLPAVADFPAQRRFDWVPINCTGSVVGAKLRRALIAKHERWTRL